MFGRAKSKVVQAPVDDDVDPIAEADVYMAYGRQERAIEILKEAIKRNPGREALGVALAKIENSTGSIPLQRSFDIAAEFDRLSPASQAVVTALINRLLALE